ncbi:MAG: hypothetical protein Q9159_005897 [Coniocarpon cinnabarinum]
MAQNHSISINGDHKLGEGQLNASLLRYTYAKQLKPVPAFNSPEHWAQRTATDHMITVDWNSQTGWSAPQLQPYGEIGLSPSANVLQYATTCFEGLKLYRGYDGRLRLFRPELNARRMAKSAERISLPSFDPGEWLKLLVAHCATDGPRWLPENAPGAFLYLRPTLIGTDPSVGVGAPKEAKLIFFMSLMAEYYSQPGGLKLLASTADTIRAWPGGFGTAKLGANYGPTLKLTKIAREQGFNQVLWLFPGPDGRRIVTEAGTSNFFIVWRTKEGAAQLVTAPIDGELILEGITRGSLLQIARERLQDIQVVERDFSIDEMEEALKEGRLLEAFVAGTAYFVSTIVGVEYEGRYLEFPTSHSYGARLREWMADMMYGREDHDWGHVVDENR